MPDKTVGLQIAEIRQSQQMSQEEFANTLGVSRQTVSFWEAGQRSPKSDSIKKICRLYKVDPGYFYGSVKSEDAFAATRDCLAQDNTESSSGLIAQACAAAEDSDKTKQKRSRSRNAIFIIGLAMLLTVVIFAVIMLVVVLSAANDNFTVRAISYDPIFIVILSIILILALLGFAILFILLIKKRK